LLGGGSGPRDDPRQESAGHHDPQDHGDPASHPGRPGQRPHEKVIEAALGFFGSGGGDLTGADESHHERHQEKRESEVQDGAKTAPAEPCDDPCDTR